MGHSPCSQHTHCPTRDLNTCVFNSALKSRKAVCLVDKGMISGVSWPAADSSSTPSQLGAWMLELRFPQDCKIGMLMLPASGKSWLLPSRLLPFFVWALPAGLHFPGSPVGTM